MIRSLMFVPGNQPDMIQNAYLFDSDAIIFDLEDAVLASEKDNARNLVGSFLSSHVDASKAKNLIRINEVGSQFYEKDLSLAILPSVFGIVLPKATLSSMHALDKALTHLEETHGIKQPIQIIPIIEQAFSVLQVEEIASLPRVFGMILGAEDLARDLEVERTKLGDEILYARSRLIMAASASHVLPIDTPYTDIQDDEVLKEDCAKAKMLGMKAKCAIHPRHIDVINKTFSPSMKEIEWSKKILKALKTATLEGKGSFSVEGKMVDKPIIERAMRIRQAAILLKLVNDDEE